MSLDNSPVSTNLQSSTNTIWLSILLVLLLSKLTVKKVSNILISNINDKGCNEFWVTDTKGESWSLPLGNHNSFWFVCSRSWFLCRVSWHVTASQNRISWCFPLDSVWVKNGIASWTRCFGKILREVSIFGATNHWECSRSMFVWDFVSQKWWQRIWICCWSGVTCENWKFDWMKFISIFIWFTK